MMQDSNQPYSTLKSYKRFLTVHTNVTMCRHTALQCLLIRNRVQVKTDCCNCGGDDACIPTMTSAPA